MEKALEIFIELSRKFHQRGYDLYLVGGAVRDFLLNIPLSDMDASTNMTPEQMKEFIPEADFTFAKYGSIRLVVDNIKFDITTFREEEKYLDKRHPTTLRFVNSIDQDFKRRDFTINAIYMDKDCRIIDPSGGLIDLKNKTIRTIGGANKRIKEDPLRILRAIRLALDLGFILEPSLKTAIKDNEDLLNSLNPQKIKEEIHKIKTPLQIDNYHDLIKLM